jgi:hypothetical protein
VMRVLGMVPIRDGENAPEGAGVDECYCPHCCGSACGVIVACGSASEAEATGPDGRFERRSAANGGLCTVYLACGD